MIIPIWLEACLWGLLAGGSLVLGAAVIYLVPVPQRTIASLMAFGSGVLISALSFELVLEAFDIGGFTATSLGFAVGALLYSAANWYLNVRGAQHRKRSQDHQMSEKEMSGSGSAIAVGALLDGIPESMVIGLTLLSGSGVSLVTVIAIFISNIPEGLSSASGMRNAGRSPGYVFGVWIGIALLSGLSALAGYAFGQYLSPEFQAATTALAAGAILAMLVDTMIPEACADARELTGLFASAGFLAAFALSMLFG